MNYKQRLLQTYNGITYTYTEKYTYITPNYDAMIIHSIKWTETYYRWNLTQYRLKSIYTLAVPIIRYNPDMASAHPSFSFLIQGNLTVLEP